MKTLSASLKPAYRGDSLPGTADESYPEGIGYGGLGQNLTGIHAHMALVRRHAVHCVSWDGGSLGKYEGDRGVLPSNGYSAV